MENEKKYRFTFESGAEYFGTIEDKNYFMKHLTKRERQEFGKIVSKEELDEIEWTAWNKKVNDFLAWI